MPGKVEKLPPPARCPARIEPKYLKSWNFLIRALAFGALYTVVLALACNLETAERTDSSAPGHDRTVRETPYLVSLSPIATRFLLEIGDGDRILGVDAQSQKLAGLGDRPVVTLETALQLGPDLVLTPERPAQEKDRGALEIPAETRIVEFAPHDLEDVFELVRTVGEPLVGRERANRFSVELSRPLAQIGGESFGQPRPRTAAVIDIAPVTLAGGHSFETDLIEIAGGSSVTHGGDETRRVVDAGDWAALSPDLVVVMTPLALSLAERKAALGVLPVEVETVFFPFAAESFWLDEPVETARRFRTLIADRAQRLTPNL